MRISRKCSPRNIADAKKAARLAAIAQGVSAKLDADRSRLYLDLEDALQKLASSSTEQLDVIADRVLTAASLEVALAPKS